MRGPPDSAALGAMAHAPGSLYRELCRSIHGTELGPFGESGELPQVDSSYPHTNLPRDFLAAFMQCRRPLFLLEVGSMTGGSANRICDALALLGPWDASGMPCLVCVDTFLGDTRMWLNHQPGWRDMLRLKRGFPGVYWQFLANVERHSSCVLPFPTTSSCGIRALQHLVARGSPRPEFIYLDSAHEAGETLLEIRQAFKLLAPGGAMVGDDLNWPAVEGDLRSFLRERPRLCSKEEASWLPGLPGVAFLEEGGHWVVDGAVRQWLLVKSTDDDLAELKATIAREECGVEPAEYAPLTDGDRQALEDYNAGCEMLESGQIREGNRIIKQAAAASPSLASHFGI